MESLTIPAGRSSCVDRKVESSRRRRGADGCISRSDANAGAVSKEPPVSSWGDYGKIQVRLSQEGCRFGNV